MPNERTTLPALLQAHKEEIRVLLPKYLDVDRFIANASAVAQDRALQQCSPESIYRCCLDAARRGWEVGGPNKHCAVIPFKLKSGGFTAILIPQWQGKAFLWSKSGAIRKLKADVVYEGDEFRIESGDEDRIIHRPDFLTERKPSWLNDLKNIIGAYAVAWLASGERVHAFVSRSQIVRTMEAVKRKNEGNLGFGWTDWLPEMCKKTAIHRLDGIIQPPPDMTPDQLDAWQRAGRADEFAIEVDGAPLPPDNLPTAVEDGDAGVAQTGEHLTRNQKVGGSTPPASSKPALVLQPEVVGKAMTPADETALLDAYKQRHGGSIKGIGQFVAEVTDARTSLVAEMTPDECGAYMKALEG